ncbi:ABC transporter ATP-binding protein [Asanoa iriomotensis]|uniref:ABC transporter n=1 Tax=Asanoa iriomotensis TaxID=234613 RepID=A0ABQ4C0T5_9ACTN|nr:ABC transporter ATP-binding protein [Asanoa iriomotensis]GIF56390.1 ABC transporter [Asanoa iriomotensis]
MSDRLRVSGLSKAFGAVPVLTGIDLEVPAGGLTALLGRSGSGKTTLLRIIAGFGRADAGEVRVGDRDVTGMPSERRRIGYVTQDGNLFPHLTVAGNVTFGLPWRARRRRHRVEELLELVGLDPSYAGRLPHSLSGGEQQRVALARALAPEPDILLLDEPFSALDAELRSSTRRAVAATLRATRTTALLVTHDQSEAMSLADRVAVLRDGVVRQEGTARDVYLHPVDLDVAGFVGEIVDLPATFAGATAATPLGPVALREHAVGSGLAHVRPEQIEPAEDGTEAEVTDVELHGGFGVVRAKCGPVQVTARWPTHLLPQPGSVVRVRVRGAAVLASGEV